MLKDLHHLVDLKFNYLIAMDEDDENIDVCKNDHLLVSNMRVFVAFSFRSLQRRAFCFLFEVPILSRFLLNVTDMIFYTCGQIVSRIVRSISTFGRFSMISTCRSCETWPQDLMRLGLNESHQMREIDNQL